MIPSAQELRQRGADDLKGRWSEAALLTFVYCVITCIFSATVGSGINLLVPYIGSLASLLLIPMGWGFNITFLTNHRGEDNDPFSIERLFDGYRDFSRIFLTLFLLGIYVFLWSLLLIVPGIIKALSYSMTCYILRDYPELKNNAAIEMSMAMMEGHKADLFWLYLTFIGWGILCILTLGIGYFWLQPYMSSTLANFYEEVKADFLEKLSEPVQEDTFSGYSKSER